MERGAIFMAQISVRLDDDVKRFAEEAYAETGLSMLSAIMIYGHL